MILVCKENNDLYKTLISSGFHISRYENSKKALEDAMDDKAILILADDYPAKRSEIDGYIFKMAQDKSIRLFIEYPEYLPNINLGEPRNIDNERIVVSSDFFCPDLERYSILTMHSGWFLPVYKSPRESYLVLAKVAGYRKAVFGLPQNVFSLLFNLDGYDNILVATTKLSHFITGRYAPKEDWKNLWKRILYWLTNGEELLNFDWKPIVTTIANSTEDLHQNYEFNAFSRSVNWFKDNILYSADQKKGAIEGFESIINYEGRQLKRNIVRADCLSETALVFAYSWKISKNPEDKKIATEILNTIWFNSDFFHSDPNSPTYGLVNWNDRNPVFYGDDNARVILSSLKASSILEDERWLENILVCILSNWRLTGPLGFRKARFDYPKDFQDGKDWRFYNREENIHYSPHYQAFLWACYLWLYGIIEHREFLEKTQNAIKMTMEAYPDGWRWTNGLTQEMARMLLPLSFLVRVENTKKSKEWLYVILEDLKRQIKSCGAIQEKIGRFEVGDYPPPKSNEEYGKFEAPLIQENGDPICDLLYTNNYAFLGVHEASSALNNKEIRQIEDKMAEFFCRIQVKSSVHNYLNGCWMRGFDYELWEYCGSSADIGWGPWAVESGWTNSWIASVLAMRYLDDYLFNLNPRIYYKIKELFPRLLWMISK